MTAIMTEKSKKVLNVGGGSKKIKLPDYFDEYEQILLDIDPKSGADVIMDARELKNTEADVYDAIYCAHNLEHYYAHDAGAVLAGFKHIIKPEGFIELRVPDIKEVFQTVIDKNMGLTDTLYETKAGLKISPLDVIYGHAGIIKQRGIDFMAHKTGFNADLLRGILAHYGFKHSIALRRALFEIRHIYFQEKPSQEDLAVFKGHFIVTSPSN